MTICPSKYNGFDALDWEGNFNANGFGLMIFGKFLGDKMINTTSTTHMRSYASYTPDQKRLYVYLINKINKAMDVQLEITNQEVKFVNQAWELTSKGPDDKNPTWKEIKIANKTGKINISGTTIMVIDYTLQ